MTFLGLGFPVYFGLLLILNRIPRHRQTLLLAASWLFYLRAGPESLGAVLAATAITLVFSRRGRKTGTALLLGLLLAFRLRQALTGAALPAGLSFYTFTCMGYLLSGENFSPSRTALLAGFFPCMVQGPILPPREMGKALEQPGAGEISLGLQRMLWGYFKKLVVADRLAVAVAVLRETEGGPAFWLLSLVYGLRIWGDFTGGMDIALGCGQCLGIPLPENFRHPFLAKSAAEFWRRWHITLGGWMKQYVFYPICVTPPVMAAVRRLRRQHPAAARRLPVYLATLATWVCTGLWHGLGLNFLVWGLMNGTLLLLSQELEPVYRRARKRFSWMNSRWFDSFRCLRTFTVMNLIRLCDLYPQVGDYFRRVGRLFSPGEIPWEKLGLTALDLGIVLLGLGAMAGVSVFQVRRGSVRQALARRPVLRGAVLGLLILSVLLLGCYGMGYDPDSFIYNRF